MHAKIMPPFTGWTTDAINLSTFNQHILMLGTDGIVTEISKDVKSSWKPMLAERSM